VITSIDLGEDVCIKFENDEKVIHIYIFGNLTNIVESLKNKYGKIKLVCDEIKDFLKKL
jgi:uncharacterized protein YuzE